MREVTNTPQSQQSWQAPVSKVRDGSLWRPAPRQHAVSENPDVQPRAKRIRFDIVAAEPAAPSSASVPQLEVKPQEWQFVGHDFAVPPQVRKRNFAVPREMVGSFEWKDPRIGNQPPVNQPPVNQQPVNQQPVASPRGALGQAGGQSEELVEQMLKQVEVKGWHGFVDFMLAHWEAMPAMRSQAQRPVLVELVLAGQYDAIRNLLLCANADQHLRAQCSRGANAMMHAALAGDTALVQCLLGVAPRLAAEQIGHRIAAGNALMLAACNGHHEVVELLLQVPQWAAMQLNCRSDGGENALMYAAANGKRAAVQKLLRAACIVANQTGDAAPIHSLTGARNQQGLRAIDLAGNQGHERIVKLLAPWTTDSASLPLATSGANLPIRAGCSQQQLAQIDRAGMTPIDVAREAGKTETLELLQSYAQPQ